MHVKESEVSVQIGGPGEVVSLLRSSGLSSPRFVELPPQKFEWFSPTATGDRQKVRVGPWSCGTVELWSRSERFECLLGSPSHQHSELEFRSNGDLYRSPDHGCIICFSMNCSSQFLGIHVSLASCLYFLFRAMTHFRAKKTFFG